MTKNEVIVIDVGISNLFNVKRAFESIGANVIITDAKDEILNASKLVLPGVGAFGAGIKNLKQKNLIQPIRDYAKSGKPLFGICLGMQMLFSQSEEHGFWEGLGIIPGKVRAFQPPVADGEVGFKIPQMGWNYIKRNPELQSSINTDSWENTALQGLGDDPYMYFVHSYVGVPDSVADCLAYTFYGHDRFCSVVQRDNVTGCQFHPERSGEIGIRILENFLKA